MAGYLGMENERRVPAESLQRFIGEIFKGAGLSGEHAELMAEIVVHTDARGIYSHGSQAVAGYVDRLLSGKINPKGQPRIEREYGSVIIVDGDCAMGHIASVHGMRAAIKRARLTGVALAAIRNSNHCGAMSYYPTLAIAEDLIGICSTNALPSMAPWGGLDRIVGLNPIGVGIPSGEELPILLDVGFSAAARGKVAVHFQKGLALPAGWAFDSDGRPTTDAAEALKGLLQPIGGPKGVGLGLVVGVITGLLTMADYGTELGSVDVGPNPGRDGQLMMAIDISVFEDVSRFKERVDAIVRQIHESRPMAGVERIYVPGERALEAEKRYRSEGIPIADIALKGLASAAAKVGVDAAWLR
jgi:LDH2 family malate/lactate/ureidoglycolate dehydrogenase